MQLTSTSFRNIESIPLRYSGEGDDVSPSLIWSDLPVGCKSLALICEDPDAPQRPGQDHPFVHWILFNLNPDVGMLPEGIPQEWKLEKPVACEQGLNSMGRIGYNGPFPPAGHGVHRFVFTLFALSEPLHVPVRPMKEHLMQAMEEREGLVLGSAQLIGTYERAVETDFKAAG